MVFDNPRARACGKALRRRLMRSKNEHERALLSRVVKFPFDQYPDYTAPWHLLLHERQRWEHVWSVIYIIEKLRQPTGSRMGQPIELLPFQVMILLAFLGPEDARGIRIVREGLMTLSRKNGKTSLVAATVTALMALHPENHGLLGQEIQVGASDRDQAGITHQMVERFIHLDDSLGINQKFRSVPSKKTVQHLKTLSQLRCLSSDAHRHYGGNPAIVLLDEIGNVSSSAAEEFYSVLTSAFGAQEEPLTLLFSTQAPVDQHFFSQQVDLAKAVNEGRVDNPSFAGFVFSVPETDDNGNEVDPYDESLWHLSNPGLGSIVRIEDIRDRAKKAKELPSLENKFRLLRLNQRVSETSAFISRTVWEENIGVVPDELRGRTCWLGVDLSETTDLTALVALFEPGIEDLDGRLPVVPSFWIPGDDLRGRVQRDHVPYDAWVKAGYVDASSARTVDYHLVAEKIVWYMQNCEVRGVGFDRYRMKYLRQALDDLGYYFDPKDDSFLVPIGQGFVSQTRSVEVLETLLLNRQLSHGGNPVLRWNASNAVLARDPSNNRKFEKAKSFGRIDGVVALAMAAHVRADHAIGVPSFDLAAIIG